MSNYLYAMGLLLLLLQPLSFAGDWPMWRHDAGRTATSLDAIPALEDLEVVWTRSLPKPKPAYRDVRLQFDAGYEPIVLGSHLIVASNVDDSVTAFDTRTGKQMWKFYSNGPVRFAPVAEAGRVIFGSDDGCVYALRVADGSQIWKHRAVPSQRLVLGNERLISVWPVRGGPVLHEGRVFFAAGVWPIEGTFVYCLDAKTGKLIWRNDKAAYRYGSHPHNAEAYGGLAPQGYLLIDGDDLVVPSSQAYPARFDWRTGELKSFDLPAASRKPGGWFASTPAEKEAAKLKRRGLLHDADVNRVRHEDRPRSEGLPAIRTTVRIGDREIAFADGLPGLTGAVHSVIAGDGMLFASMKSGKLVALGEAGSTWAPATKDMAIQKAAKRSDLPLDVLANNEGYALCIGLGSPHHLQALNEATDLHIVAIDAQPRRIAKLRGLGGSERPVHFITSDPGELELPAYFASTLLLGESVELTRASVRAYYEALRPFGGIMLSRASALEGLARAAQLPGAKIETQVSGWTVITRSGALPGATNYIGDWEANADERVKAPLGLLWYGDSITHFKRSPQPRFVDGVMVSNPKLWTDSSTRERKIDYRLIETVLSDIYTGRTEIEANALDLPFERFFRHASPIRPLLKAGWLANKGKRDRQWIAAGTTFVKIGQV